MEVENFIQMYIFRDVEEIMKRLVKIRKIVNLSVVLTFTGKRGKVLCSHEPNLCTEVFPKDFVSSL